LLDELLYCFLIHVCAVTKSAAYLLHLASVAIRLDSVLLLVDLADLFKFFLLLELVQETVAGSKACDAPAVSRTHTLIEKLLFLTEIDGSALSCTTSG